MSSTRPFAYTEELGQQICSIIATNSTGLVEVSLNPDMPELAIIANWLADPAMDAFKQAYNTARRIQADLLADEMIAIADMALADGFNAPQVSLVKIRIETREWKASKLAPHKYGAKPEQEEADAETGKTGTIIKWGDYLISV
jgi:hypothetical protein